MSFMVSSTVYAHSIFMIPKRKADQTCLLYFHCFLSPNRENLKICLPLKPLAKWKKIGTEKSKALADTVVEEVDILVDLLTNEKERTDMKLENACMLQEIADMSQEIAIAVMKLEKAGMR